MQTRVQSLFNYLINMPDKTHKQTLCVMPMVDEKPSLWEEIRKGKFHIINGQHTVAARKAIVDDMDIEETTKRHFRVWKCFAAWITHMKTLWKISAFYNRVNHLSVFKPSWSTNILLARSTRTNLGRSTPPNKKNAPGGRAAPTNNDLAYKVCRKLYLTIQLHSSCMCGQLISMLCILSSNRAECATDENICDFRTPLSSGSITSQEFIDAMQRQFANIDVSKNQILAKKFQ